MVGEVGCYECHYECYSEGGYAEQLTARCGVAECGDDRWCEAGRESEQVI